MAVIPYTALTGAPAVDAAVPAPLARLSQGLLRAASRLHVATGWGASQTVAGGRDLSVRAYGPSWEWVTVAAQVVPLDGATTWQMRVRGSVTGDVMVRADRGSDGVAWVDDVMVLDVAPRPIGGGLALVELQILSVYAAETTAAVTWVDALTLTATLGAWEPRELVSGSDRYVVTGAGNAVWPARRVTSPDGTYQVGTLGYLDVLGVHVWGESDGIAIPTQRGDVRILRSQDFTHRSAAAALLGRTPYVQDLHVIDAQNSPQRMWWQRVNAFSETDLWDDLPVDEQEAYALTLLGVHDGLGSSTVRLRLYVDGVEVGATDATWPALQPDTGDGGSTLRFLVSGGQAAPFWREEPLALETVTVQASGATPGLARITLEIIDGDATQVVVAAMALVPTRPAPAITPNPTGTRIQSLVDYLTAPDEPWGTLRREIASWQDLDFSAAAAVSVYEASPVPIVRVRVDAVLTDCTLEVELVESDGVTSAGTILLDATGETDLLMDGSIDVPGGEWYYVRVDTTDAGSGAVGGVRLYEEKLVDPTSLVYADRATLLAATPLEGATGYVATYAGPVEVWQYTAGGWAIVAADWDGTTTGQELSDLLTYDGVAGALARVGVAERVWDGSAWVIWRDEWDGTTAGQTIADLFAVTTAPEGATVLLGETPWTYDTAVTVDATAGGGSMAMWLPTAVYQAGTAEIQAYSTGTEADTTALAARGYTTVPTAGTATFTGTHIQLDHLAVSNGFTRIETMATAVTASTRVLVICETRGTLAAGANTRTTIGFFIGDGTNAGRWQQGAIGGPWGPTGGTGAGFSIETNATRDGGSNLPVTSDPPEIVVLMDEGRTVMTEGMRAGRRTAGLRRVAGTSAANAVRIVAGSSSGGTRVAARMDVFRSWVITW